MTKTIARLALVGALFVSMTQVASAEATYKEGSFAISARAGVAPASHQRKMQVTTTTHALGATIPSGASDVNTATVVRQTQAKGFSKLHSLPFTFGADLGYFAADNLEIFLGFDYAHAKSKAVKFSSKLGNTTYLGTWKVPAHTTYSTYLGARSYFCGMDSILPFVGAKIGTQRNIAGSTKIGNTVVKGSMHFSGGVQMGFDYAIADNTALTFMSEVIGTSGLKFNREAQVNQKATLTQPGLQSQVKRTPGGTFTFPVTLGIRFRM